MGSFLGICRERGDGKNSPKEFLLNVTRASLLLMTVCCNRKAFERVRMSLAAFDDVEIATHDYENAAGFFNRCRRRGVTATPIDLLICAVAARHDLSIFTTDRDFVRFQTLLGIKLHAPRSRRSDKRP